MPAPLLFSVPVALLVKPPLPLPGTPAAPTALKTPLFVMVALLAVTSAPLRFTVPLLMSVRVVSAFASVPLTVAVAPGAMVSVLGPVNVPFVHVKPLVIVIEPPPVTVPSACLKFAMVTGAFSVTVKLESNSAVSAAPGTTSPDQLTALNQFVSAPPPASHVRMVETTVASAGENSEVLPVPACVAVAVSTPPGGMKPESGTVNVAVPDAFVVTNTVPRKNRPSPLPLGSAASEEYTSISNDELARPL